MAADFVPLDVVEQILIRSHVQHLIRFKKVCKSWHSLISSPRFTNRHLDHRFNKDQNTYEHGHRRIFLKNELIYRCLDHRNHSLRHPQNLLVGSSNGLVCITSCSSKVLVGNPLTRDVRELKLPPLTKLYNYYGEPRLPLGSLSLCCLLLCWGFGYDSVNDDYVLFLGVPKGNYRTFVLVLSLRTDVWRFIGYVDYKFISNVGVFCNGALHWVVVKDILWKNVIVSYDLSKGEFSEIAQPDHAKYECIYKLGVVNRCLSVSEFTCRDVWVMRKHNVKESWRRLRFNDEVKYDVVHFLRLPEGYTQPRSFFHPNKSLLSTREHIDIGWKYIDAPVFVESLVSPHAKERSKGTSYLNFTKNNVMLFKGDVYRLPPIRMF